jgi:hypothetical protein
MVKSQYIRMATTLSTLLLVGPLWCQTPDKDQSSSSVQSAADSSVVATQNQIQDSTGTEDKPVQYAAALDGSGLISLDSSAPSHFLFGAAASGGWDSNPQNTGTGASSGIYAISPYLGIQANSPNTQILLQYQPTITGYSSSSYSRQSMNVASAKVLGTLTERWAWDLKATGNYGQDSIRFLGPQQAVAVGEVPGTGPASASYLSNLGTVTSVDGTIGASYRSSERDTIGVHVGNAYGRYSGLGESNSIISANLNYDHAVSPTFGVSAYGQNAYYYGSLRCESYGAGVGIRWRPSENTSFSLAGGPQLNTSECSQQQGFSYNFAFSTRLSGTSQVYLVSTRQPTVSFLGPGLWLQSVSGGYQQQVKVMGTVSFDVGYANSSTLTSVSSYQGTYFDAVYGYRLGHGVRASYSYRGYIGDSGTTHFTRNVAMFSIAWTPSAGHIFQ